MLTHRDVGDWCWFISLYDETHSVGIVQNEMATAKRRQQGYYLSSLSMAPGIKKLCSQGTLISNIKSASDWCYSASSYTFPNVRIVGDAGCFIDPYFSYGVHLSMLGGLSAAVTISASINGDCDDNTAASWHSKKIIDVTVDFFG